MVIGSAYGKDNLITMVIGPLERERQQSSPSHCHPPYRLTSPGEGTQKTGRKELRFIELTSGVNAKGDSHSCPLCAGHVRFRREFLFAPVYLLRKRPVSFRRPGKPS